MFNKLGIKVPKAWEETIEAAKELTGGGQYSFTWSFRWGLCSLYATSFKRITE